MKKLFENWREFRNEAKDPDSDADDGAELRNVAPEINKQFIEKMIGDFSFNSAQSSQHRWSPRQPIVDYNYDAQQGIWTYTASIPDGTNEADKWPIVKSNEKEDLGAFLQRVEASPHQLNLFENWREFKKSILNEQRPPSKDLADIEDRYKRASASWEKARDASKERRWGTVPAEVDPIKGLMDVEQSRAEDELRIYAAAAGSLATAALGPMLPRVVMGRPAWHWLLDGDMIIAALLKLRHDVSEAEDKGTPVDDAVQNWLRDVGVPLVIIRSVMKKFADYIGRPMGPGLIKQGKHMALLMVVGAILYVMYRFAIDHTEDLANLGSSEQDQRRALELTKKFSKKSIDESEWHGNGPLVEPADVGEEEQ